MMLFHINTNWIVGHIVKSDASQYSWIIDFSIPTIVISDPSGDSSGEDVFYTITYYDADLISLSNDEITINTTDTADGTASVVQNTDNEYIVTISEITGIGTISILIEANTASNNNGHTASFSGPSTPFSVDDGSAVSTGGGNGGGNGGGDEEEEEEDSDNEEKVEEEIVEEEEVVEEEVVEEEVVEEEEVEEEEDMHPVAPIKPTAEQIEIIIEKSESAETAEEAIIQVILPQKIIIDTHIQECSIKYPEAVFDNGDIDTDGDGLSDKTECYIATNPLKSDSDGDGCIDGDEINQMLSDPNDPTDCSLKAKLDTVTITNPQPGWIVKTLEISGITPDDTKMVTFVVIPAERKIINNLIQALISNNSIELNKAKNELGDFLEENKYFEYKNLWNIFNKLDKKSGSYEDLLDELKMLDIKPILLGTTSSFNPSSIDGGSYFEYTPDISEFNNQLYDLIATSTLIDNTKIISKAIRFSIDGNLVNLPPIPLSIANMPIEEDKLKISNIQISLDKDERVFVTGRSEYGSQVFAIWHSVVLASSVISDSEEGYFSIQAPKILEENINHKVTLYATKLVDDKIIRSENVDINFYIAKNKNIIILIGIFGSILLLLILLIVFRRRIIEMFKKKHEE